MNTNNIIELKNVSKKLGNKPILKNVNLTVSSGEVIGIVGTNGSGKTTILRHIVGLMYPDQGEVRVLGEKVEPGLTGKLPTNIGALIESPIFLPYLSGLRNLTLLAGIRGLISKDTIRETLALVGLDPENKKTFKTYSQGMRQKLGIAQAIMENPKILLLDEPTNGLDQDGVQRLKKIIKSQVQKGVSVILVSHIQEDIDELSDRVFTVSNYDLKILRKQKKIKWIVSVKTLEEIENISHNIPSFEFAERVNGFPTGVITGEWNNKEELHMFLENKGINPIIIKGETK